MSQTNNIHFNVHEVELEVEDEPFEISTLNDVIYHLIDSSFLHNPLNPMNAFFSVIENEMNNSLNESLGDTVLERGDITINVDSQKFNTLETDCNNCSVCINDFKKDDIVSLLTNCKHVFHTECIIEWGKYKQECPLCRSILPILK